MLTKISISSCPAKYLARILSAKICALMGISRNRPIEYYIIIPLLFFKTCFSGNTIIFLFNSHPAI